MDLLLTMDVAHSGKVRDGEDALAGTPETCAIQNTRLVAGVADPELQLITDHRLPIT
jgi:hypothetical protein